MLEMLKNWLCSLDVHYVDGWGLIIGHGTKPDLTPTSDICYCEWCSKKVVIEADPVKAGL